MIRRRHTLTAIKSMLITALLSLLVLLAHTTAQGNDVDRPLLAPQWHTSPPGQRLSTGAPGADGPVMAISPDGSKIMVAYNYRVTGPTNRDPYTVEFDGQAWSAPIPVVISAGSDSAQVALTYDANNVAHLVWEEPGYGLGYMRYNGSEWVDFSFVAELTERIIGASISATGSQTLDVVYSARPGATQNPNIYHSRSTNGGASWSTPVAIAQTAPTSQAPKIAHDAGGRPHVVWQETTAAPGFAVHYTRGLPWSTPITISPGIQNARRPALAIAGNTVHVAFTNSVSINNNDFDQWATYTRCSNNCSAPASWSAPLNASGQPVRVNTSAPSDLIASIVHHQACTYIFFHGYIPNVTTNEVVWNVNSCDGWAAGGRSQVTGHDMRGIYPQAVMRGDTIHLVYEWVQGANRQIYTMRGAINEGGGGSPGPAGPDGVYLPFIARP